MKEKRVLIFFTLACLVVSALSQDIKKIEKEIKQFEEKLTKINNLLDKKGKTCFFHGKKKRLKIYGEKKFSAFNEGDFCVIYISGNKSYLRNKNGIVHTPTREINYDFRKITLESEQYLKMLDEHLANCDKKIEKLETEISNDKNAINKHIDQLVVLLGNDSSAIVKDETGNIYIDETIILDTRKNKLVSRINRMIRRLEKDIAASKSEIEELEREKTDIKTLRNKAAKDIEEYKKENNDKIE
jgi:predicted  nucleic acid-binding Zn-ribbon protein